ncbi:MULTISPECIES: PAC2 family protein [unclassified Corynebacterium]|uniref:PAC2 family protein n=1 Tax=unclassified Corynebacterium TaxID=2624378 RepID=UPI001EF72DF3|nr:MULTISPECIES: PAC2 family protein [unclassified Corynebacterium]MCG7257949.1 PAC2 family protein [Corynebacterium sp. ACRQK]MCG7262382.1 PAC2 family protein [Corynebacterium sp. ACRQL]
MHGRHEGKAAGRMYEMEYPAPIQFDRPSITDATAGLDGTADGAEELPMLVALQGYADAGQAVSSASSHLLAALDHSPVASFKVDELIDYRSRRPGVIIDNSKVVDSDDVRLDLHLVKDTQGRPFLLLSGLEPDLKWGAFSDAVVDLARRGQVGMVASLYSAPMTVPHTRPLVISAHASDSSLIQDFHTWESRMIVPGAAALETEKKLNRHGFETIGLTAHVPHYIAASDYPEATLRLLQAFADVADRDLPLKALEKELERVKHQLQDQVEDSQEIATVVSALEHQYDAEMERMRRKRENNLLKPGQDIPTGEELGAEFEAFLQNMSDENGADTGQDDNAADTDEQEDN